MADILQINWRYDKIGEESKRPNFASGGGSRDYSLRTAGKKRSKVTEGGGGGERPARKRGPKPRVHTAKMSKYRRKVRGCLFDYYYYLEAKRFYELLHVIHSVSHLGL